MEIIFFYLFKAFIASGILWLYYWLVLRNKSFHSYNRFYLLASMFMSLIIPFVPLDWLQFQAAKNIGVSFSAQVQAANRFNTAFLLCGVGILISCILLFLFVSKIFWIYRVKAKSRHTAMQGYVLVETTVKQAPFSFLNNLFWKQELSMTDANGKKIFNHELTHILQKHTYDKLFAQIVCCVFWINPFYWLMQKELNTIHEFIADASCIEQGNREGLATMLLYAYDEGSYLSPSHSFFSSSLSRRLQVIGLSGKTSYSLFRKLLAIPVILIMLIILSVTVTAQRDVKINPETVNKKQSNEPITVIGYKTNKKPSLKMNTDKSNQTKEPITVTGYKLKKTN
ncbi:MAG: hypothetical protein KF746_08200 [Chitinophagaceae bacterium]|nr:hypothetical protein [Chitinophagaceae bacterium]